MANHGLPLAGVRIIECGVAFVGPAATQLMADLGAEVIKVERPHRGGGADQGEPREAVGQANLPHGLPYHFENNNRNKKSIVIDLNRAEGKKVMYGLAAKSSAFVQNFAPGVVQRLGIDYPSLRQHNASLVYANGSGFGQKGPLVHRNAMQPVIDAETGLMLGIGEPDAPPVHLPGGLSDQVTAIMLAYGIMVALFHRERTGMGQELDVSMLGSMVWVQTNNMLFTLLHQQARPRQYRSHQNNPLVNSYRCRDGRYIMFGHSRPDKYWPAFCRALGLEGLINDPRFCDIYARERNCTELISILDTVFATRTLDEWLDILASEDLIYGAVRDYWEVVNSPQVLENDYIVEVDHPSLGRVKEIGIPVKFSQTPGTIRDPAPQPGQHTDEILIGTLGFSRDSVAALRDQGVVA